MENISSDGDIDSYYVIICQNNFWNSSFLLNYDLMTIKGV